MPNDNLGQFPAPGSPTSSSSPDNNATSNMQDALSAKPPLPEFEETPEEIPSPALSPEPATQASAPPPPPAPEPVAPQPAPPPSPQPATMPAGSGGSSFRAIIFTVLFIIAVGGLIGAAFLYQQTSQLRQQLAEISATVEQQQTQPATTPTPSIEEIPTTPTPESTPSATPSASPVAGSPIKPLSIAPEILKTALDYQPNAQFLLLKTENANDSQTAVSKYFFRFDLTNKKYFYVLVIPGSQPEIVSAKVTPDNNIPSLNDLILQNQLGIDLDEALDIVYSKCSDPTVCQAANAQAQFIKLDNGNVIWQISLYPSGSTQPMVMQINAQTKAILFRTSDFLQS